MLRLPVRTLAEFVHRRGDLHARLDGRTRAEEGIHAQRMLQKHRSDAYQRERPVTFTTELAGCAVTLAGRIDGCDLTARQILVEEFKTTRADADEAYRHHGSVHWAQARLYAGLLASELADGRDFELKLLYCHPETLETRIFTRVEAAADAVAFLDQTLRDYETWLAGQCAHEALRDGCIRSLGFPFPEFRPFQRAMARRAYRALRDREHLLLEAPTGSGKTAATVFPALKALASSGYRRVLFLTSRTTGALAVRDCAHRLDPDGAFLRHVTIVAKEKACFLPGTRCEPDACPFARGYYDRARGAVVDLLERRAADPETVAQVARHHQVCPFELSLDTASWCDLVVADYNYVFDPVVRLQRFAGDSEAALLVDESHQLAPRVREMLSLTLSRNDVTAALAESPPDALRRRLASLDRALTTLRRREGLGEEKIIERPEPLLRSIQRLVDEASRRESGVWERSPDRDLHRCGSDLLIATLPEIRDQEIAPTQSPLAPTQPELPPTQPQLAPTALDSLLFTCHRWLRSDAWYHPERFRFLAESEGRSVEVRLACIDPGPYIRERLDEFGGHVRFSGTVSPLDLYAHLHGEADAPAERAGNPFSAGQLRVLVVDDVPVYLRRREQSLDKLTALVHEVSRAQPGHYLVAFPSFQYLNLAADAYQTRFRRVNVLRQAIAMSEPARQAFLEAFAPEAPPCIGFVVMGGVFGESVDFSNARLAGVVCVGVGLPPPSLTRRELERHFTSRGLDGTAVAYHQPAMVKVLQMAGRLLRSPGDRGVLCLVDGRFRDRAYRRFFPAHWQPRVVAAARVAEALADFWHPREAFTRLRAVEQNDN